MKTVAELNNITTQERLPLPHVIINTSKGDGSGIIAFSQQIHDAESGKNLEQALSEIKSSITSLGGSVSGGLIFKGELPKTLTSVEVGNTYVVNNVVSPIYYNTQTPTNVVISETIEKGDVVIISKAASGSSLPEAIVVQKNMDSLSYLTKNEASSTYLSKTDASSTYLTKTDGSNTYLTKTDATNTYLTKTDANNTYVTKSSASSHTHASNAVNAMTGYTKPSATSAITATDTLNVAIGKLEKALDGKVAASSSIVPIETLTGYTTNGKNYAIQKDSSNHLYVNVPWTGGSGTDSDTLNTAGATNSTAKLFLIGAQTQGANPQTYSSSTVSITNGVLAANQFKTNGDKVLIENNGDITAIAFYESSDRNLKENIQNVGDVDKVNEVEFKEYNFKSDATKTKKYGVIAQELEEVGLDNLVNTNKDGVKSVDYISLLCLKIAQLEERIKELENNK